VAEPFIAAVVQSAPVGFDTARTLDKVRSLAGECAAMGAKLVVFPEAFVGTYPKGSIFGGYVGGRTPEGRDAFRRYHHSAIEVPGPEVEALAAIAAEAGLHMVIGVIERDGGTLYCTVLHYSPDRYLGKHRKLMPTGAERMVWGFGDGSTMPVYQTPLGKLGSVICWENYMPLMRTAMYAKQIELYCAPTLDGRPTWPSSMQHIAIEGRCFVFSANQFAHRSDYPADFCNVISDAPDTVLSPGGSCIVDPFGNFLAGPDFAGETILTAEIDIAAVMRGKYDFDVVGHYARPDVFQLSVDERRRAAVVRIG
jgi:nitrilase